MSKCMKLKHHDVKPCPYCGCDSGFYIGETDTLKWCAVFCPSCGAHGGEVRSDYFWGERFVECAIDEWNCRCEKDLPKALIEDCYKRAANSWTKFTADSEEGNYQSCYCVNYLTYYQFFKYIEEAKRIRSF